MRALTPPPLLDKHVAPPKPNSARMFEWQGAPVEYQSLPALHNTLHSFHPTQTQTVGAGLFEGDMMHLMEPDSRQQNALVNEVVFALTHMCSIRLDSKVSV